MYVKNGLFLIFLQSSYPLSWDLCEKRTVIITEASSYRFWIKQNLFNPILCTRIMRNENMFWKRKTFAFHDRVWTKLCSFYFVYLNLASYIVFYNCLMQHLSLNLDQTKYIRNWIDANLTVGLNTNYRVEKIEISVFISGYFYHFE